MLKALPAISRNKRIGRSLLRPYQCPPSLWRALYYIGFDIVLPFGLTVLLLSTRREQNRNPNSEASNLKPEAPYSTSDSAVPRGGAIAPPRGGGTALRNGPRCAGDIFRAKASRFTLRSFNVSELN